MYELLLNPEFQSEFNIKNWMFVKESLYKY